MRFSKPMYHDSFRRVFAFGQYSDNRNCFVELEYVIGRDAFISRLTPDFASAPELSPVICAENGREIFRDCAGLMMGETLHQYKLIKEEIRVENFDEDVYTVVETYGYPPAETFVEYDAQTLAFSGYTTNRPPSGTTYAWEFIGSPAQNTVRIKGANNGDMFYFKRPELNLAWHWEYSMTSAISTVYDEAGSMRVSEFNTDYQISDGAGTWTYPNAQFCDIWARCELHLYRRTVQAVQKNTAIELFVQYFAAAPEIIRRSRVLNAAGVEVSDAAKLDQTKTDATLWNGRWVVEDSSIEREGNLYKRITKVLPAGEKMYLTPEPDIPVSPEAFYDIYIAGTFSGYKMLAGQFSDEYAEYRIIQILSNSTLSGAVVCSVKNGETEVYSDTFEKIGGAWFAQGSLQKITAAGISGVWTGSGNADFVSNYSAYLSEFLTANNADTSAQYAYTMTQAGVVVKSGTAGYSEASGLWC